MAILAEVQEESGLAAMLREVNGVKSARTENISSPKDADFDIEEQTLENV